MNTITSRTSQLIGSLVLISALAGCGSAPNSGSNNQDGLDQVEQGSSEIFTDAPEEMAQMAQAQGQVENGYALAERMVQVNLTAVKAVIQNAVVQNLSTAPGKPQGELRLNLFQDARLNVLVDSVQPISDSNAILSGHVEGEDGSVVSLVMKGDVLVGNVRLGTTDEVYEVRHVKDGIHAIRAVNPDLDFGCATDANSQEEVASEEAGGDMNIAAIEPMSAPLIDIVAGYTPAAKAKMGGKDGIEALIQLGITDTNRAYDDSGINAAVRLAGIVQLSQNETGNWSSDLNRLKAKSDGKWDEMHRMRESLGADQISVVGAFSNSPRVAGIGIFRAREDNPVTLTRASAFSQYTFSHELGHNLGLAHEDGLVNRAGRFRTIMAYGSVKRIRRFSNPSLSYNGYNTGDRRHNEASIINKNASKVAGFRSRSANADAMSNISFGLPQKTASQP